MGESVAVDPREAKLPRWAQQEMARLRRVAETCERWIAEADKRAEDARLNTRPDDCDTVLDRGFASPVGLGDGVRVVFKLRDRTWRNEITVRVHPVSGRLEVSGSRPLTIIPQVSNVFHVEHRHD